MLFTTLQWVIFLLIVFVAYHLVDMPKRRWVMLVSSICFYASWSVPFLALLAAHLLLDWSCGFWLGRVRSRPARSAILISSVVCNLGSLAFFKYYALITTSLAPLGLHLPSASPELPLGISFFVFESLSYTIDVYRGRLTPFKSPIDLALFVTWFPHLIAGPIIRPAELAPQLEARPPVSKERFFSGAHLMAQGYIKKLLFADWLAHCCDPVFANPAHFTSLELLIGIYAYSWQIYFDFSAYTDIARGASRWFTVDLPENFDDPYLSASITEFWRRWHMSLSHWLRDYLYIPLGGNRNAPWRTYLNLMLTMLLGGLWHGASWTFAVWGGLHGAYLACEKLLGVQVPSHGWQRVLRQIGTFHLVALAWIFFRSPDFAHAWQYLAGLTTGTCWLSRAQLMPALGSAGLLGLYATGRWLFQNPIPPPASRRGEWAYAVAAGLGLVVLTVLGATSSAFIYFQF